MTGSKEDGAEKPGLRLGSICRCSFAGRRLTYALNAVIALLSALLAVLIRTVFT